jgi:hypothetical protein
MNTELKKAIVNFMFDNSKDFQLINNTTQEFRPYIYDSRGNYLIGGKNVANFIKETEKLIKL